MLTGYALVKEFHFNFGAVSRIRKLFLKLPDEVQLKLILEFIAAKAERAIDH